MKIYCEIVKNTEMGIQAIDNIMNYVESEKLKNVLLLQKDAMSELLTIAKRELSREELDESLSSKMQKTMLKAGVHMNAMFNSENTHIASLLIDGYNTGLTSVQRCINELTNNGVDVPEIGKDLIKLYDKNIKTLRTYL